MNQICQAVILAGGAGTRLQPLTNDRPKPMVLANGRPFLEYLVEMLKSQGITEIVMLLGYMPEKITSHFGDGSSFGISIKYSIGSAEDQTGARIRNAAGLLNDQFMLLYCDNYWPVNLAKMAGFYDSIGVLATTTVFNNNDGTGEYGFENNVFVGNDNHVVLYDKTRKDPRLNGTDIGFFILKKEILNFIPEGNISFESEVLPRLAAKKELGAFRTDHPYYPITDLNWLKRAEKFLEGKKAVLLDRDGVINRKPSDHDYVKNWNEFEFLPGAVEALSLLNKSGYKVLLITNQAGISRGMMTLDDLKNIHNNMHAQLASFNAAINEIYYCPHKDDDNCQCRKPKPGLIFKAARDYYLDLSKTIFIGDSESDRKAGEAAGCRTIIIENGKNLLDAVKLFI